MAKKIFPTGYTEKNTTSDEDLFLIADSNSGNKLKKVKKSNLGLEGILASNNLSDLQSITTARANLDVYSTTEVNNKNYIKTTGSTVGNLSFWTGTQAQYDALTPDGNTQYLITDA